MHAAPTHHPSSIMSLHSTTAGGRRRIETQTPNQPTQQEVVGDVILKGKREFWGQTGMHYHQGLPAGENTLNAWWAKELMHYLIDKQSYELDSWVQHYIQFMTADPPRHPDTYAESCHRGFFANWANGTPPLECGAVTHDTPSMGALVTLAPLVIALSSKKASTPESIKEVCRHHVWLTHPDQNLMHVVNAYVELMLGLLNNEQYDNKVMSLLQNAINATGRVDLDALARQKRGDAAVVGAKYSLACYISDSWPSVCYLAAKYHNTPGKALIVNTNLGGENAHRGSVLGTLVGAASGEIPPDLIDQLAHVQEINALIETFLEHFCPVEN